MALNAHSRQGLAGRPEPLLSLSLSLYFLSASSVLSKSLSRNLSQDFRHKRKKSPQPERCPRSGCGVLRGAIKARRSAPGEGCRSSGPAGRRVLTPTAIVPVGNTGVTNELPAGPLSLCATIRLRVACTIGSHVRPLPFSSARWSKHISREPPFFLRVLSFGFGDEPIVSWSELEADGG